MTAIFHTYIKCGDKIRKIIIDNRSCINAISLNIVPCLSLKPVSYLKPYNVSWVNNYSLAVNNKCLFPIKFLDHHDEIWCDVIPINVGHVILGRPWMYDLDVTISGQSNWCSFAFKGRKIKLIGLSPRPSNKNKKKKIVKEQGLNTMSLDEFKNEVKKHPIISGLVVNKNSRNSLVELSKEVNMANLIVQKSLKMKFMKSQLYLF